MDRFNEFYMMQTQAKKLEQNGMDDKALELYLKIIQEYAPNNDFSFERAATLLEKKSQYAQALEICEKTIALIESGDLEGDAGKYKARLPRIRQKMAESGATEAAAAKAEAGPEVFKLRIPGLHSDNRILMGIACAYYAIAAFVSYPNEAYYFGFLVGIVFMGSYGWNIQRNASAKRRYTKSLTVCILGIALAVYSGLQFPPVKLLIQPPVASSVSESTETGNGSGTGENADPKKMPEIPDAYLEATIKAGEKHHEIEKALVTVSGGNVLVELSVKPDTDPERIKAISDDMLDTLGGLMKSKGLKGPKRDYHGEVYDFYSVSVFAQNELDKKLLNGYMSKGTQTVNWEEIK